MKSEYMPAPIALAACLTQARKNNVEKVPLLKP